MNKAEFERYNNYKPNIIDYIIYILILVLYCASLVYFMLKSSEIFTVIQKSIFNRNNDIFFAIYSNAFFFIPFSFFLMFFLYNAIFLLINLLPIFKNTLKWIEVINTKGKYSYYLDYNIFTKKKKRNLIITIIVLFITSLFSLFLLFVHLRINDNGLYYTKFLSFRENKYEWSELSAVLITCDYEILDNGQRRNLLPKMELQFANNTVEIWQNAGIGSPDANEIIKTIDMIKNETNISINVGISFDETMYDILNNHTRENKKDNIERVLLYLKE
jgi:flagellar basal body-associated protein FliL